MNDAVEAEVLPVPKASYTSGPDASLLWRRPFIPVDKVCELTYLPGLHVSIPRDTTPHVYNPGELVCRVPGVTSAA